MSISSLPEGFSPHKGIKRVFDGRHKMVESGEGVDWGFAEALAFGTLVSEGGSNPPVSPLMASLIPHRQPLCRPPDMLLTGSGIVEEVGG